MKDDDLKSLVARITSEVTAEAAGGRAHPLGGNKLIFSIAG
jgi:hypothetical protein